MAEEAKVVVVGDEKVIEITRTASHTKTKANLLSEKECLEHEIQRSQAQLAEIEKLLALLGA